MTGAEHAEDGGHGGHAPAEAGGLERRYRRLLVFYPVAYRRVHDEEMLAVLMTAAPAGKRRPGIAETTDLIWGALRVRFQPQRDGAEPAWRDALAILTVILPAIILLVSAAQEIQMWLLTPGMVTFGFRVPALQEPALAIVLVAVVLLRWRHLALLAAAGMVLWVALFSGGATYVWATEEAYLFVPLGLEIIALAASPGPRRGVQVLSWKLGALVVIATLAVAIAQYAPRVSYLVSLIVLAVIGLAMLLASSRGRWLLLLLTIAAWPFLVTPFFPAPWGISPTGWAS
ncbi:MAG: hypothetical protein ACR2MP_18555 [Streptosporangiaceae bacterium]